MKIYTKTGDAGETGLFGGNRVSKTDPRVEAYGTVDELNASLGLARAFAHDLQVTRTLADLQNALFEVGADLATPHGAKARSRVDPIDAEDVAGVEASIDAYQQELAALESFILPAGNPCAAAIHVARSVCRRAERRVVGLAADHEVNPKVQVYLNRVSDLLFVLARIVNMRAGVSEDPWRKRDREGEG